MLRRTLTGDAGLPADPLGVLLGRQMIDQHHYNTGRNIAEVIERARARFGVRELSVQATWLALIAGAGAIRGVATGPSAAAERWATAQLGRYARAMGHGIDALVFALCSGEWLLNGRAGSGLVIHAAKNESLTRTERSLLQELIRALDAAAKVEPSRKRGQNSTAVAA